MISHIIGNHPYQSFLHITVIIMTHDQPPLVTIIISHRQSSVSKRHQSQLLRFTFKDGRSTNMDLPSDEYHQESLLTMTNHYACEASSVTTLNMRSHVASHHQSPSRAFFWLLLAIIEHYAINVGHHCWLCWLVSPLQITID